MNVRSWRQPATSALLAIGGAAVFSLCFGRQPSWWLPAVGLVPLVLLLERRRAVFWGLVYGVVLWLGSMYWIAATLGTFGGLSGALTWLAQGLMTLYLGLDQAVFVFFGRRLWRRGGAVPLWALPALWVVLEWLRGAAFGRFPWNLAAYAWVDMPGALALSAWVGAFGVSYLLVFVNVCFAAAWTRRRWELAAAGVLLPLALLAVAGRFSSGGADDAATARSGGTAREVRVIQPNSRLVNTWEESWEGYHRLIEMSEAECEPGGERKLLVWPESAAWPHTWGSSPRLRRDVERLAARGCDVLLNTDVREAAAHYNSALLITAEGPAGRYSKRQLVPWGEYVPLKDFLPFMGQVARAAGDFTPGSTLGLLPWGDEQIAVAICYEIIFPGAVAQQVRAGGSLLITITNDAWYGDTTAPWQHFRAARFRAAENRRPLVRAALTGVSGLIDRRGAVKGWLGVGEEGVLRGRIAGSRDLTVFSRAPWLVPLLCALLAVLGIAVSWKQGRMETVVGADRGELGDRGADRK